MILAFHALGDWPRGAVRVAWAAGTRRIVPEVERLIERAWIDASARLGPRLFDGPMCRLESFHADEFRLEMTISETSYKPFFGTNLHHAHLVERYGREVLANPVGLSTALISADGYLVFGRRSGDVAYYPHRVHPFAGALEPREHVDVFDDVLRELDEELRFNADDISDIRCTGLVEDISLHQPELIFTAWSKRTRDEIESRAVGTEHAGSVAVRASREAIEAALAHSDEFTPVGIATLLLFGREQFGHHWFMSASERFWYDPANDRDQA